MAREVILLVAINPVAIMTDVAATFRARPPRGSSAQGRSSAPRLRRLRGARSRISPPAVHALAFSRARQGRGAGPAGRRRRGAPAAGEGAPVTDAGLRRAACRSSAGKGAAWPGIDAGLARIVRAVAGDERVALSLSMRTPEVAGTPDAALSRPRVPGRGGRTADLVPDHDAAERRAPGTGGRRAAPAGDRRPPVTLPFILSANTPGG